VVRGWRFDRRFDWAPRVVVEADEVVVVDEVLPLTLMPRLVDFLRALAYSVSSKAAMRSLCMFISIWPAICKAVPFVQSSIEVVGK